MSLPVQTAERTQLTVEQIIRAAMEVLERDGVDRLTIRALAKELGVAPGAVYYYVDSKEELLHRIGGAIAEAVPVAPPGLWPDRLRHHVKATVATFGRFPGSDALAGSAEPWRHAASERRVLVQILTSAGVSPEQFPHAVFTVTIFLAGALRIAEILRRAGETRPFSESAELDAAVDTLIAGLRAQYGGGEA
jgi:TetR/AcrR family tetracycline transcriptional repressor